MYLYLDFRYPYFDLAFLKAIRLTKDWILCSILEEDEDEHVETF